jgi:hypothetical protein
MREHAALCQARGYVQIDAGWGVEAAWEAGGKLSFPLCCNLPVQGASADAMLHIPEEIAFAIKPQLARGMIERAIAAAMPFGRWRATASMG